MDTLTRNELEVTALAPIDFPYPVYYSVTNKPIIMATKKAAAAKKKAAAQKQNSIRSKKVAANGKEYTAGGLH